MTREMREFLTAWLDWAQGGGCEYHEYGSIFRTDTGLCSSIYRWAGGVHLLYNNLLGELGYMLKAEGLDTAYPFDTKGSYDEAARLCTQHRNPARLEWVRSKLESKDA